MSHVDPNAGMPTPTIALANGLLETRWRFEAPDLASVEQWLRTAGQRPLQRGRALCGRGEEFAIAESAQRKIHDRFLDAPDLSILRAGYALRIRKDAHGVMAALIPLNSRPDTQTQPPAHGSQPPAGGRLAAEGRSPSRAPRTFTQRLDSGRQAALFGGGGQVAERLHSLGIARKLRTLVDIRRQQHVLRLSRNPSSGGSRCNPPRSEDTTPRMAELVLDSSTVTDPLGRTHRLSRVDLVIPAGSAEAFQDLAGLLRRECDLSEATRTRFDWAMQACGIQADRTMSFGHASVDPVMSVGEVADAVLRKQCASFFWHEPGTRLGEDPEHLHDMRVASRRMRAALRLFRSTLPPEEADGLRLQLREVARALGAVRDLDVFIIQLGELSEKLVGADADACEPLLRHLFRSRGRARRQMMKLLDDASFVSLKRALASRMRAGAVHETPEAGRSILTAGPVLIRRCRRRVLQSGRGLGPDSPAADYHGLRIRGKRLRYALEFLEGVYGPSARDLIDVLVEMQDQLGLLQDARVSVQALRAITKAKPAGFTRETWVALGELIQLYEARASDLRRGIPRLLRRMEGKRWRALNRAMKKLAAAEDGQQSNEAADGDANTSAAKEDRHGVDPPSGAADDPLIDTDGQDDADPPATGTRTPWNSC
jgi:triphosphatase